MQSKENLAFQTGQALKTKTPKHTKLANNPREGWAEAAAELAASGEDKLLIPDVFEDENFDHWVDLSENKDKS